MNDERGFLLTELTVTIALLVVVLAVAFIFFFFCQRSFSEGEKKTIVQSNVRLAANYITKEVRYADNISTTMPGDPKGRTYYCLKLGEDANLLQEIISPDNIKNRTITRDSCLETLTFKFRTESVKHFVRFEIKGHDETRRQRRDISSEVLLVNIKDLKDVIPEGSEEFECSEIYFTKPGD
jgi:hypothetical protein